MAPSNSTSQVSPVPRLRFVRLIGRTFFGPLTFFISPRPSSLPRPSPPPRVLGVEARSLTGSYPIINRVGAVAGSFAEVDVNLQLAWRLPTPKQQPQPSKGPEARKGTRPSSASGSFTPFHMILSHFRRHECISRPIFQHAALYSIVLNPHMSCQWTLVDVVCFGSGAKEQAIGLGAVAMPRGAARGPVRDRGSVTPPLAPSPAP